MNLNNNKFKPGLYCVATPIGNMGDISFRAIKILQESDLILCEDTRVTKKILQKFEINKKLISNHKFNEKKNIEKVLEILKNKKIVSLVSDAGTPAVSDPGRILVKECIKNGIDIFPLPGASAVTAAISISGFSDTFYFCGFLPEKQSQIKKLFKNLSSLESSIVFFISPNKLDKRIDDLKEFFLNRDIVICREISKYHEEYIRTSIKELSNVNFSRKGEITVIISEPKKEKLSFNELEESDKRKINQLIKKMSIKDIVKKVSEGKEISKKLIYNYCLEKKNEN
ncbi:16S rRNA (cytidine(1402)-2'-O)-methyltransferase [Candidatus Pelagibacter sp.]|nr:16S rRNA (cytidine(1402)-2'-O)-methyltransferase [Candidatus Pelagibacter sp.]MDC3157793.1 16S rRNA (cytidine(1402)-2'-O)-methyltransferase [Candidatus Pelagibacter sp.]